MAARYLRTDDGDLLPEPGDAPVTEYEPHYGVVVELPTEREQVRVLRFLLLCGYEPRALFV